MSKWEIRLKSDGTGSVYKDGVDIAGELVSISVEAAPGLHQTRVVATYRAESVHLEAEDDSR